MKIVISTLSILLCTTRVLSEKKGEHFFLSRQFFKNIYIIIIHIVFSSKNSCKRKFGQSLSKKMGQIFFFEADSKIQLFFFPKVESWNSRIWRRCFSLFHPLLFPTKRPTARVGNFFERSRLISLQFWNTITTSHYLGSYDHSFWENLTSEITFFKDRKLSDKKKNRTRDFQTCLHIYVHFLLTLEYQIIV